MHSPVVPSAAFLAEKIRSFLRDGLLGGDASRIWVNPDCGLKTRRWEEVLPALRNMVSVGTGGRALHVSCIAAADCMAPAFYDTCQNAAHARSKDVTNFLYPRLSEGGCGQNGAGRGAGSWGGAGRDCGHKRHGGRTHAECHAVGGSQCNGLCVILSAGVVLGRLCMAVARYRGCFGGKRESHTPESDDSRPASVPRHFRPTLAQAIEQAENGVIGALVTSLEYDDKALPQLSTQASQLQPSSAREGWRWVWQSDAEAGADSNGA